ncbi:MAG TPA: hypothetical protein VME42_19090 [Steroidobacteraceae bacterium]|nr:hypothetical protein [Steroidobacteraceae bacterium]
MTTDTLYSLILVGVLIVALVAVLIWAQARRKREQSARLQQRFGPEYIRAVNEIGDRSKAEAELQAREKRMDNLDIVPLCAADAARFRQAWTAVQTRFIDNPQGSVVEADHLVYDLMARRGYPMGDFERRAADISVDHPNVVANYRAARAIALRDERGEASTEDLRKAVVHYRALFQELLEVAGAPALRAVERKRVPVSS